MTSDSSYDDGTSDSVESPKLVEFPVLLAALPDMGNVAGLVTAQVEKSLNSTTTSEIPSTANYIKYEKGIASDAAAYSLSYDEQSQIAVLNGEQQPEEEERLHELCRQVVEDGEKLGVKTLISVGASYSGDWDGPKVRAVVNDPSLLEKVEELGIEPLSGEGSITGFNGVILGVAQQEDVDAFCLLADIPNPRVPQPKAAMAILKVLSRVLGVEIETTYLEDQESKLREALGNRFKEKEETTPGVY